MVACKLSMNNHAALLDSPDLELIMHSDSEMRGLSCPVLLQLPLRGRNVHLTLLT